MKLKYIATAAIVAGGILQSCSYTDLDPLEGFTDQSYWKTATDLELYSNNLLTNLPGISSTYDDESDDMITQSISDYLFNTMSVSNASGWDWTLVRNCNYFITHYETAQCSEADKNKYLAEVRFIRALRYFALIKRFGDVPWYDEDLQTDDIEQLYKPRDPRNFVLGKIIEDLQFGIQWLPEKSWGTFGERPHKDAARQQLARVALYYGTYMKYHNEAANNGYDANSLLTLARDMSAAVMNSSANYAIVEGTNPEGTFTGSEVTTTYTDGEGNVKPYTSAIYPAPYSNQFIQPNISQNRECVMGRYYDREQEIYSEVGRQEGTNGIGYSYDFAETYLMKDGTPIHNSGSGYQGDATYETMMADRDPRMYQTIMSDHRVRQVDASGTVSLWPLWGRIQSNSGVTGLPSVKFWSSDYTQWNARNTNFNYFIYRYAEALLINAEANAELGSCTQAVLDATINLLRDRVGMAHLTVSPVADAKPVDYGYTVDPLLYEIRRERRVELAHEGFRMDDIKRWNAVKLLENPLTYLGIHCTPEMEADFAERSGQPTFSFGQTAVWQGETYLSPYNVGVNSAANGRAWTQNDRRWLYPIPEGQITLNPALTQNPGWN